MWSHTLVRFLFSPMGWGMAIIVWVIFTQCLNRIEAMICFMVVNIVKCYSIFMVLIFWLGIRLIAFLLFIKSANKFIMS